MTGDAAGAEWRFSPCSVLGAAALFCQQKDHQINHKAENHAIHAHAIVWALILAMISHLRVAPLT